MCHHLDRLLVRGMGPGLPATGSPSRPVILTTFPALLSSCLGRTWTHKSLPLNLCTEPVTEAPLLGPQPPRPSSHPDGASAPLPKSPLTSAWNALPPLPYKSRSTEWGECSGVLMDLSPPRYPGPCPVKVCLAEGVSTPLCGHCVRVCMCVCVGAVCAPVSVQACVCMPLSCLLPSCPGWGCCPDPTCVETLPDSLTCPRSIIHS